MSPKNNIGVNISAFDRLLTKTEKNNVSKFTLQVPFW